MLKRLLIAGAALAVLGTDELHRHELEIINMIYCHVMSSEELLALLG